MKEININIFNIIGSKYCVEADEGQKIYDLIVKALKEDKNVKLSFQNIEMLTTAFLNTAVGQLYRDYAEDKIKKSLSVEAMTQEDMVSLKRVNKTAKLYYKNPERMINSINEILGEE